MKLWESPVTGFMQAFCHLLLRGVRGDSLPSAVLDPSEFGRVQSCLGNDPAKVCCEPERITENTPKLGKWKNHSEPSCLGVIDLGCALAGGSSRQGGSGFDFRLFAAASEFLDDIEGDGNQQDSDAGSRQHSSDDHRTQNPAGNRAGARGKP